jgi:arginase
MVIFPTEGFRSDADHPAQRNLAAVVRSAERVCDRARQIASEGDIPLFLGGDCTLTIGAAAGISDPDRPLGLAYLDGDADLDVPGEGWGIFDSMGVAHLLGHGAEELAGLGRTKPLISPNRLVLFGFHPAQLSQGQTARLADSV